MRRFCFRRAIDNVFCQALFLPDDSSHRIPDNAYATMAWGVNQALARMIPDALSDGLLFDVPPLSVADGFRVFRDCNGLCGQLLCMLGGREPAE